jgi:hypothetical protein
MGCSDQSREHGSPTRRPTMTGGSGMVEWVFIDAEGAETGTSEPFDSQTEAEAWFGTNWEALAASGTVNVALRDTSDGSEIYRMGLGPE